jgi:hypothetical protein
MLTARELQTLRNEANLYEDAADEIETLRDLVKQLRDALFDVAGASAVGGYHLQQAIERAKPTVAAADAALREQP